MARFDWKAAIVAHAHRVESALMMAGPGSMFPEYRDRYLGEAKRHAEFAAWLARSYCRKGSARA